MLLWFFLLMMKIGWVVGDGSMWMNDLVGSKSSAGHVQIRSSGQRLVHQGARTDPTEDSAPAAVSSVCGAVCSEDVIEANPRSTVISVDGVSAFDSISRESVMHGLMCVVKGGGEVLPIFRQFMGNLEDDEGITHTIPQGEGGQQGDAVMPLFHILGQHSALEAIHRQLRPPRAFVGNTMMTIHVTRDTERRVVGAFLRAH